jgi:hypothetical protein
MEALVIFQIVFAFLCILVSLIIIILLIYGRCKDEPSLQGFEFELLLNLSLASDLNTLAYIINIKPPNELSKTIDSICQLQAGMMILFELAEHIWTFLLLTYIYTNISSQHHIKRPSTRLRIKIYVIGYVIPFIFSLLCFFLGLYGPSGKWCWLDTEREYMLIKVFELFEFVFLWFIIVTNISLMIIIKCKRAPNKHEQQRVNSYIRYIISYPIIQLLCILPPTVNRFVYIFTDYEIYYLEDVYVFLVTLQDLLYTLVYILNPAIQKILLKSLKSIFGCESRRTTINRGISIKFLNEDKSEHDFTKVDNAIAKQYTI